MIISCWPPALPPLYRTSPVWRKKGSSSIGPSMISTRSVPMLAGLFVRTRGGIVVNEKLQTSDKYIYAIGECALAQGMIYGLVAPGYEMADIVVSNLIGGNKTFTGFDMSTKLKLIGVDVASFG